MEKIVVNIRKDFGKSAVRDLRKDGFVPCVLHNGSTSSSYSINSKNLLKILTLKRFFLTSFEISDNSSKSLGTFLVRNVEYHPVTSSPLHIDFMKVTENSDIIVTVPIIFQNKDIAPGLLEGGQMKLFQYGVKMKVPFKDMPREIAVNLGNMKLFDIIKIKDLPIPSSASLIHLSGEDNVAFMKGVKAS